MNNERIEKFSIESGESIPYSWCSESYSTLCKSGQCYEGSDGAICIDGFEYDGGDIVSCEYDSDCVAKSGNYSETSECLCGYNSYGYSYCEVLLGSSYWKDYIDYVKSYVKSDIITKSHKKTTYYYSLLDWGGSEFETFLEKYVLAFYYHRIYNLQIL